MGQKKESLDIKAQPLEKDKWAKP